MRKFLTTYLPASMFLAFLAMIFLACEMGGEGGGGVANAASSSIKSTPISWKVSGTVAYVTFAYPIDVPPFIQSQNGFLVSAVTKGAPGNAQFTVTGWTGPPSDPFTASTECDPYPQMESLKNDFVATFEDQSMIFATLDPDPDKGGYVCQGPLPAVFNMIITGGTGRFEGAGGYFQGTFDAYPIGPPVNPLGALLAETGTIEGEIFK